ncbi:hypothetical protein ABIE13_000446 [Ottowia thiooxydans]|uniref:Secreted protein n=1 Tax=Ottowia thiooxydans TaxID=219182 RepID=A0ABV2Q2T9_9BURK
MLCRPRFKAAAVQAVAVLLYTDAIVGSACRCPRFHQCRPSKRVRACLPPYQALARSCRGNTDNEHAPAFRYKSQLRASRRLCRTPQLPPRANRRFISGCGIWAPSPSGRTDFRPMVAQLKLE